MQEEKPKDEKALQPAGRKALTARNRIFLDKLSDGVPPVDAYRLAGYTGSPHTAYELKRQLKAELREMLEAKGFTLEGLASEILNLSRLPVDLTKYPNGIPLDKKIQIMKLHAQLIKDDAPKAQAAPHVTAFIINRGSDSRARVSTQPPVDIQAVEPDKP